MPMRREENHREGGDVAVLWHRFGPYHHARLKAAAQGGRIHAIEMSGADVTYGWQSIERSSVFEHTTVFPSHDCDLLPPSVVRDALHKVLSQCRPSVVAIPGWGANYGIAALEWAIENRVPTIVMTESSQTDKRRQRVGESVKRKIVRLFNAALVGGSRHKAYLETLGMPSESISLGYDAVDNEYFLDCKASMPGWQEGVRKRFGLPVHYILCSARFIEKKNLEFLIRGFATFCREESGKEEYVLVLMGDGILRERLEAIAAEIGINHRVKFVGFVQYQDIASYYALASLFVLPSREEQWGLVVNEALASRLPVAVSDRCGCVPELVQDGLNGYAFDPEDAGRFVGVLKRMTENAGWLESAGAVSADIISQWGPVRFGQGFWEAVSVAKASPIPRARIVDRMLIRALSRKRNVPERS